MGLRVDAGRRELTEWTGSAPAPAGVRRRESEEREELGFRPALDGVRGLAVLAVLLFHGGFGWARGGFLGVSLFFTLSGFLIATLAMDEQRRTGTIRLVAFWGRRARRLLPPLALTLALAVGVAAIASDDAVRRSLPGDVLAGAGYVANWRFVYAHVAYADLFRAPSPLLHLWSLSVEEQFYVVFPLLALGALRVGRWLLGAVAALWLVTAVALPPLLHFGADRAYYGTDVRGAEIALGVLLAVIAFRVTHTVEPREGRPIGIAAVPALGALVVAWITIGRTDLLFRTPGFLLYGLAGSLVVLAATIDAGPVARLCRTPLLRRLGLVSYGLYLYHWPIFWLIERQTNWSPIARFTVGFATSYAIAELSLRLIEMPIRRAGRIRSAGSVELVGTVSRSSRRTRKSPGWVLASVVCIVAVVGAGLGAVVVRERTRAGTDFEALQERLSRQVTAVKPADQPARVQSVGFFGDSTALMTGQGFLDYTNRPGIAFATVANQGRLGCGFVVGTKHRIAGREIGSPTADCGDWPSQWRDAIEASNPDIAVVQAGAWDTFETLRSDTGSWGQVGQPAFDRYVVDQLRLAVNILTARGARVVFLSTPPLDRDDNGQGLHALCRCEGAVKRFNDLERQVADEYPGRAFVVDLAGWVAAHASDDARMRPDGLHFTRPAAAEVAEKFLAPSLTAITAASG